MEEEERKVQEEDEFEDEEKVRELVVPGEVLTVDVNNFLPGRGTILNDTRDKIISLHIVLKQINKKVPFCRQLRDWKVRRKQVKELVNWERQGKPIRPPQIVKQRTLHAYSKRFGLKILVETGTYHGEMIEAMMGSLECLYSIELSEELYEKAKRKFKEAKNVRYRPIL